MKKREIFFGLAIVMVTCLASGSYFVSRYLESSESRDYFTERLEREARNGKAPQASFAFGKYGIGQMDVIPEKFLKDPKLALAHASGQLMMPQEMPLYPFVPPQPSH